MTATETTTTVVVPGTHLMAALVGPRDQHLRQIEDAFPRTEIHVRGNEVTCRGERAEQVGRLFEELVGAAPARPRARRAEPAAGDRHGRRRRAAERGAHPRRPPRRQGPSGPTQVGRPEALHRRHRRQRHHVRHRSGRHRQVVAGRGDGGARRCRPSRCSGSSSPARPSRPASGSASCPGDLMAKIDPYLRPLYDALLRHGRARGRAAAARAPDGRGGAAGLHARSHAQQQLHHPRRGAEHDAGADEDVPHPHRLRVARRRHRRRHADRRPQRQERAGRPGAGARPASTGSPSCT